MPHVRATTEVLDAAHRALAVGLERAETPRLALDATVGNGHDTLFLAERVGRGGLVVGFDVQAAAIEATRARLEGAGLAGRAELVQTGHETLAEVLPGVLARRGFAADARCDAACFNLGYLPRGDKRVTTQATTTLAALDAALGLLAPGGVLTAALYPGHEAGAEERESVLAWAAALPIRHWHAQHIRFANRPAAPELLVLEHR